MVKIIIGILFILSILITLYMLYCVLMSFRSEEPVPGLIPKFLTSLVISVVIGVAFMLI